jgi:DNA-binding NarL/FixJ family response regulator
MTTLDTENHRPTQVMIIEDDDAYRESLQSVINESERLVCGDACCCCEEALALLKNGCIPDIILLDIQLPGMSGIDGAGEIRAISPVSKIIILTVFDDDDKIFNAICQGAIGYLLKSSPSEKIISAIEDVVAGGAAMSPTIAARVLSMFGQYSQPQREYGLTNREKEILQLLVNGLSKKHLADQLHVSLYTVNTHLKNVYAKLHVHSQIDVVAKILKEHLL